MVSTRWASNWGLAMYSAMHSSAWARCRLVNSAEAVGLVIVVDQPLVGGQLLLPRPGGSSATAYQRPISVSRRIARPVTTQ
jgi:hypothetical protein